MRKWILIVFPLALWYHSLSAQDVVSCSQLLEDAREAYSAGMVELVPDLLVPCIESGALEGTLKQDAYKLVISAYLFDYLPEEADSLMDHFVDDFPDYRALDADPAEFTLLLNSHLRARGIDPDAELIVADDGQDDTIDQIGPVERPVVIKPPFDYTNSMGFQLGINGTLPQIWEPYSMGDPTTDEGSFGIEPGFQLGATVNLLLSETVETSFGLSFNRTRFSYSATPLSFTSYIYDETQYRLQLPAAMLFRLNPRSPRTSVYIRLGLMADYLVGASGAGTRSYTESLRDVVVEKTKITTSRSRINLHGMTGLGVRIPMQRSFIFFETRFTSAIFLVNREENRYENQDLLWMIYHVDSNFRIHQGSFLVGMAWNL